MLYHCLKILEQCGVGFLPGGDGAEGIGVENEGTVDGTHHAAGGFKSGLCACGDGDEQQAVAIVNDGGAARTSACVGVEGHLRLMTIREQKASYRALPSGEFPLYGSDALWRNGSRDFAAWFKGEGDMGFHIINGQPLHGGGVEQMSIPLPDVQLEQSVDIDAVVAFHSAVASHGLETRHSFPQVKHLAGRKVQELIVVFHSNVF